MEINPAISGILAIVVYLLGLWYKHSQWKPNSRQMVGTILGLSIALGIIQALITSQLTPLPLPDATDWVQILFVYVPKLLQWAVASVVLILSFSQGIYFTVRRLLFGQA